MYDWRSVRKAVEVRQSCTGEFVPEREAGKILNIESDFEGQDVLTYKCAHCGDIHVSLRYG
jgi:hypothetical protein